MDAADLSRPNPILGAGPQLMMIVDERESPWVVDIASGRIVRRKPSADPADVSTDRLLSS